jgi:signal transduction histidine kinase
LKLNVNSIKFRLWLYFTLFIAFTMAAIWLLQTVFLEPYYEYMRTSDLQSATDQIIQAYGADGFEATAEKISYNENIAINLFDAEGNALYEANTFGIRAPFAPPPISDIAVAMEETGSNTARDNKEEDAKEYFVSQLFKKSVAALEAQEDHILLMKVDNAQFKSSILFNVTKINGNYLFVSTEIRPIDATANIIESQLKLITLAVFLMAALISILVAISISKPLSSITVASRQLLEKKFPDDCSGGSYAETQELAETLRKTAGELLKAEKLRREFIGNISHDLRTPMTMIRAYAEAVRDLPNDDPERQKNDLTVIIRESDRMSELIMDLLELSKLESGDTGLALSAVSLTGLIRETVMSYKIYSDRDDFSLTFDYDAEVTCVADRKKIAQVLHNLVFNAICHVGEDKMVEVRQIRNGNKVRIEIRDNGEGIPADKLPFIWDRYFKIESNTTRKTEGTGLGLAIVKSSLEMHGAAFGAGSKPGEGTTFWFELDCL